MNFGNTLLTLRKQKQITQEELAAELGVTAAAVSKWEHNYTLPDILMLCALADYFDVTTDALLGRNTKAQYAVIAVSSPELGEAIRSFVKRYGFIAKQIFTSYAEALDAAKADPDVTHLFVSFDKPMSEAERDKTDGIISIESQAPTTQQVLEGFEIYFQNMPAIDSLATKGLSKYGAI